MGVAAVHTGGCVAAPRGDACWRSAAPKGGDGQRAKGGGCREKQDAVPPGNVNGSHDTAGQRDGHLPGQSRPVRSVPPATVKGGTAL